MSDQVIIFHDSYGAPRRQRESDRLMRRIEELRLRLWDGGSDSEDKRDIDAEVEAIRARLVYLRAHPEQDLPS